MFAKAREWTRAGYAHVLAAGLGVFGLVDAIEPGSRADHLIGIALIIVAAFMWVVQ